MEAKELVPYSDIERMAVAVAKSGLFANIRTPEQAATLMMLCQAEGLHPIQAVKRYDIMEDKQGRVRVSMKGEAMLAEFQARGGKVEWLETSDQKCVAIYSSPGLVKPLKVSYTIADAKRAGLLGKTNWITNPSDMLLWRNVTRGVKRAMPSAGLGMYPSEIVQDFEDVKDRAAQNVEAFLATAPKDEDLTPALEASIEQARVAKGGSESTPGAQSTSSAPGPPAEEEPPVDNEPPAVFSEADQTPDEQRALIASAVALEERGLFGDDKHEEWLREKGLGQKCIKCQGTMEKYRSERTGRIYLQCNKAHSLREDALKEGCDEKTAKAFTRGHSYAYL